jgi:hypothetical protein
MARRSPAFDFMYWQYECHFIRALVKASKYVVQRCFQGRNRTNLDALFAYQAFARIKAEFLHIISRSSQYSDIVELTNF